MTQRRFRITWLHGLAECSGPRLAETASRFRCRIKAQKDDLQVNCKSFLGLMLLAAETGAEITISAQGHDERDAMRAISELFAATFSVKDWAC